MIIDFYPTEIFAGRHNAWSDRYLTTVKGEFPEENVSWSWVGKYVPKIREEDIGVESSIIKFP